MVVMSKFNVVGIIGKLNSGKNTIAKPLTQLGYEERAFADPMKEIVRDLFDIPSEVLWGPSENRTGEVRRMLQVLGTDYARQFRPNVWVDKMAKVLNEDEQTGVRGVVIPDVRFINEASMLHDRGAILVRITRPASGRHEGATATEHLSETENVMIPLQWIDHTVVNDGSLEDLRAKVTAFIGEFTL